MADQTYKAGTILLLEEGEYSDFGYVAQLVTLQELDIRKAAERFKDEHEPKDRYDRPTPNAFVAWLCSTQQCAQLECQTLHIGGYGSLDIR